MTSIALSRTSRAFLWPCRTSVVVVIQWKMWRLFKDTYLSGSNHMVLSVIWE